MTTHPLWLLMEDKIQGLGASDLTENGKEAAIQKVAQSLDSDGYNVSRHAANMLELRAAIDARIEVGRSFTDDFNAAMGALTLEDVADTRRAAVGLVEQLGDSWPIFKDVSRRADIMQILETTKLDLQVAKAKELGGAAGIRYMIEQAVAGGTILEALGVSESELADVNAAIEAEKAEAARVEQLLEAVADQSAENKAKHLIENDVEEALILELAGIEQSVIDAANHAMAAEIEEKKRLAEEEAARKQAEAEGPSLDAIPDDEMLDFIESIREILEFSDAEDEIRVMCDQSSIPKALVDIAVSNPDKLDELEANAEG
jgi:hypothetical protein